MHLLLWPVFRQSHPNFITVRTAYASEIWVQLTKIFSQNQAQKDSERTFYSGGVCSRPRACTLYCLLSQAIRSLMACEKQMPADAAACFSLHSLYIIFFDK